MKSLVLLYRNICDSDEVPTVSIREYNTVSETNDHYIIGKRPYSSSFSEGIMKKFVGKVFKYNRYNRYGYKETTKFPVDLPDMRGYRDYEDIYYLFVNKCKYDENPLYYYDMIKNYREE